MAYPQIGKNNTILLDHISYINDISLPWVTFIDGAGGISSIWKPQIPEFKRHYNVLVLDLNLYDSQGLFQKDFSIDALTNYILRVLDDKNIGKSHFIGISLGTVFVRNLAEKYPNRVLSMVLAGAMVRLNSRFRMLLRLKNIFKPIFSTTTLFKLFVFSVLPNRNHRESRFFLINQSKEWDDDKFHKWAGIATRLTPVLKYLYSGESEIPTLYVMGEEDYLFLSAVKRKSSENLGTLLFIVQDCGHLVNMEQPILFNKMVIGYLVGLEETVASSFAVRDRSNKCSPEEVLIANSNNHSKK